MTEFYDADYISRTPCITTYTLIQRDSKTREVTCITLLGLNYNIMGLRTGQPKLFIEHGERFWSRSSFYLNGSWVDLETV